MKIICKKKSIMRRIISIILKCKHMRRAFPHVDKILIRISGYIHFKLNRSYYLHPIKINSIFLKQFNLNNQHFSFHLYSIRIKNKTIQI